MAGIYNFTIEQNSTFERKITWTDSEGNALSFLGMTPKLHIKIGNTDNGIYKNLTSYITNNNSYLQITIPNTVTTEFTENLNNLNLIYDLILEKDGIVKRLMQGKFIVSGGVTK